MAGESVSRILCDAPLRAARRDDHSSRPHLAMRLQRPTRGFSFPRGLRRLGWSAFLRRSATQRAGPALPSYLVLHHTGFAMPATLLPPRWALTPPFHPYLRANHADIPEVFPPVCHRVTLRRRYLLCGTFRDAAACATSSPGVTRRVAHAASAVSVSGLSSRLP